MLSGSECGCDTPPAPLKGREIGCGSGCGSLGVGVSVGSVGVGSGCG